MTARFSASVRLMKGSPLPDFALKNIDGQYVHSSLFSGKIVVVTFVSNHCPYSRDKLNEIKALQDFYLHDAVFLNIDSDILHPTEENKPHLRALAMSRGINYLLRDPDQEVAKEFGALVTPETFVFDRSHRLIYRGRITNALSPGDRITKRNLKDAIEAVIYGIPIYEWFIPSFGCTLSMKRMAEVPLKL